MPPLLKPSRRQPIRELLLVFGVSLGQSVVYSVLDLVGKLTSGKALSGQSSTLNGSFALGRPWLDLALQLAGIFFGVVPALLALHLLGQDGTGSSSRFDFESRAGLTVLIGVPGLGLCLASRALRFNSTVVPESLPQVWWAIPVLLFSAAQDGILEEIVVEG